MPSFKMITPEVFAEKIKISVDMIKPGKGWVYIAEAKRDNRSCIKIGFSSDLIARKQNLLTVFESFEYFHTIQFNSRIKAYVLEQYLHAILSDYRMKFTKKFQGSTETYVVEVLNELAEIEAFFDQMIQSVVCEQSYKTTLKKTKNRSKKLKTARDKRYEAALENGRWLRSLKKNAA